MICKKCGTEFTEGIFCPECGTKSEEIVTDTKRQGQNTQYKHKNSSNNPIRDQAQNTSGSISEKMSSKKMLIILGAIIRKRQIRRPS